MPKLTKKFVDSLQPTEKNYIVWDTEIRGFGARVWPTGKIVYVLKYRNKYHRQRKYTIGAHGAITPDQARDLAQQHMAEISKGNDPATTKANDRDSVTITLLCEKFLKEYSKKRHKPSTHYNYKVTIDKWIKPRIGQLPVNAVQRMDIGKMHHAISAKNPYIANRVRAVLSKIFNMAEAWGLRDDNSNPCRHIEKNPEAKRERFLNKDELGALHKALKDAEMMQIELPSAIVAIRLLLYTGCRLREILNLKWQYVDFDEQCLKLPDSKTGAKRVYYSPLVTEILNNIPREPNNPYVIVGREPGKQLNNLQKPWSRIRKAAGLGDEVRIHDLRHSFASIAASNGLALPIIGALLGHSQPQTTARYTHLIGEPLKNAAMLVNQKMDEAMQHETPSKNTILPNMGSTV